jgi:NAD(P)-dependent dehydrogenase (short-subunit alcohol dehydrogenase family)
MASLKSLMSLAGRCALITGAAGNLGTIMSETIAELGGDLILIDLNESSLVSLSTKIKLNYNVNVKYYVVDLENKSQRRKLITAINCSKKNLNIIINNAAFVGSDSLPGWSTIFENQSTETWKRAFEVNLTSIFELCRDLNNKLKNQAGSSIINIGSIYGMLGPNWDLYAGTDMGNPAAYSASKGGLIQLTRWMATTLGPNIRVNSISPGGIYRDQEKNFIKEYLKRTPLKRMATENDFRGVIAFLAGDMSSYLTGQNIVVDGGWSAW